MNADVPIGRHESSSTSAKKLLEKEIALLQGGSFCWLQHAANLEERFEASSSAIRSRRMRIEGIFCIVLFNCFLISDYFFSRRTFVHSLVVRLGFATPPAIVALTLLRRGVSKAVRESMIVFICAIFAASILYLYFDINAVVSSYAVTDLAILVFFTNVGIRIRFPYAIFASATCLLLGSTFLYADPTLSNPEKFESLAILLSAVFLSIVGNYSIERAERLNFLLLLRSDTASEALANANDRLFTLAREDKLTGIPNRGHFEEAYKRIWNDSVAAACPLSIIMIDVDNFKILNDTYGHLYGDAVLRRAATLLKECMRKEGDFVARYGGEEFVVVLPNSSEVIGLRVAERIRLLIEVAGSPAVEQRSSSDHGWTTVSCGVATILPRIGMEPSNLIASADSALYAAKSEGRNRVSVATDPILSQ